MFPALRLRRTRKSKWLRQLVAQNTITAHDLIYPIFITDGNQRIVMPDIHNYSIESIVPRIEQLIKLGLKTFMPFPEVESSLKTSCAKESYNQNNLMCRCVREIKKHFGDDIGLICDVALDPYTTHGHDGLLDNSENSKLDVDGELDVDNDKTLEVLARQALALAEAGADFVAPSDMMDGRVGFLRKALDENGFINTGIVSYAVKYASNLYAPFRGAVGSRNALGKANKATYQMDFRNRDEALMEAETDVAECADILIIKPGIVSLDIISDVSRQFNTPVFAYQVSGEYCMLKNFAEVYDVDFADIALEHLMCMKRAGARAIITYAAPAVIAELF